MNIYDTSSGFFGMWNFGRSNKQSGLPSKKITDVPPHIRTLELTGDLIGHSGAVQVGFPTSRASERRCVASTDDTFFFFFPWRQMFSSFGENGLVTCSTDHLLILWKNGERQSHLRSLALFQKLEENGGLWPFDPFKTSKRCDAGGSQIIWIYCDDVMVVVCLMSGSI